MISFHLTPRPQILLIKKENQSLMCGGRGNAYGQHDFGNCWSEPQCMKRSDPLNGCTSRKTFVVVGTVLAFFVTTIFAVSSVGI